MGAALPYCDVISGSLETTDAFSDRVTTWPIPNNSVVLATIWFSVFDTVLNIGGSGMFQQSLQNINGAVTANGGGVFTFSPTNGSGGSTLNAHITVSITAANPLQFRVRNTLGDLSRWSILAKLLVAQ